MLNSFLASKTSTLRPGKVLATAISMLIPVAVASVQPEAYALCIADPLSGSWENIDKNTGGITKINYLQGCEGPISCDLDGNCSSSPTPTRIHVFGACSPTDCDWGKEKVQWHSDRTWRYSSYDQGFAEKVVWFKLERNGQLTVVTDVDYRDNRPDRTDRYRFEKVFR